MIVKDSRVVVAPANAGAVNLAEVDSFDYLVNIPVEHHKVHAGKFFIAPDYDADVDVAAPKWWHIIVPDTAVRFHWVMQVSADQGFLAEVYETITTDANGNAVATYNCDRNNGAATTLAIYDDPTNPAGGNLVFADKVGTANPKTRIGGTMRNGAEYILKQNEKYGIKITVDADNALVTMMMEFYEA